MTTWKRQGHVQRGGHVGGDVQATESFSVRYTHTSRPGAVVDVYFYGVEDSGGFRVEAQIEHIVCEDPRRPGDTELWSNADYSRGRDRYRTAKDAEMAARVAAERHRASDIRWDGRAPWERR